MSATGTGRPVAATMVDIIDGADERADIYSMMRLRRGYLGSCRRLRRVTDNATLDVGFTTDGAYDIELERTWSGGADVYLVRWYNQSLAAGGERPGHLQAGDSASAPRTQIDGQGICLGSQPAILMQPESWLASMPGVRISPEDAVAVIWIGRAVAADHNDAGLWSIHEEGLDDARTCEVDGFDRSQVRDRGIYYDRSACFAHPESDFTAPSLIVTAHAIEPPWMTAAWVNGKSRAVEYRGSVAGLGIGAPQLLGANVVHTFIVDGARGSPIAATANAAFRVGDWIC